MDPSPTVAIVGKPNVGKSTLFNRLIGKRHAVVAKEAGTTRDRISQMFECEGYEITLFDTGGLNAGTEGEIEADVQAQAQIAIKEADIILFVVDITQELTADDFSATSILRKSNKPIILITNKCDNKELVENEFNFYELGFGEPISVSAIHKTGISQLKNKICDHLKELKFEKSKTTKKKDLTNICILGKPNAGKSSLINALFGSQKIIVSAIPGTTRDSTDTEITYNGKKYNLIDTAGIKRPGRTKGGIEKFSALRIPRAVEKSDIVVLLIDGDAGITSQDCHIAEYALEQTKGLIIAINKIDLFEDDNRKNYIISGLRRKFIFVPWAPIIFISATEKKNIYQLLELTDEIIKERNKRISTSELNSFLQKIIQKHLPSGKSFKNPKFMYGSQVDIAPPKFVLFFKNPKNLHFSYPRYLENEIRKEFGFNGTAIDIRYKEELKTKS